MNSIIELLEKLDNFFNSKKPTETYLIMLVPIFVIGYIALEIAIPSTTQTYNQAKERVDRTQRDIAALEAELARLTVNGDKMFRVKTLEKDINELKTAIIELDDGSDYIDAQMVRISDILFNRESWSLFLDSITQKAIENKVSIQTIENRFIDQNHDFGHVLEIGVEGKASFTNIVNFLASIEESELLVDVYGMDLQSSNIIDGKFKISVWGFSQ